MANKTLTMLQIRRVLQLLNAGLSQRKIAKTLNISRNTVQDYCLKFIKSTLTHDALLSLKIVAKNQEDWQIQPLSNELRISIAEISESLNRSKIAGLIDFKKNDRTEIV